MSRRLSLALSAALLATVAVSASASARSTTTITDLGGLPSATETSVTSINDSGVAVGADYGDGRNHAVKFDGAGASELVGPAGAHTYLTSVNNHGAAVGFTSLPGGATKPIRFNPDGSYVLLSVPFGYSYAHAFAINDGGATFGSALGATDGRQIPVRWLPNGVLTSMKLPAGATWGRVTGASSNGYVSGFVSGPGMEQLAVRWNPDSSVTKLPRMSDGEPTTAQAVNRHGDVVGTGRFANGEGTFGVRWNADGSMNKYGPNIEPKSINDDGVAVGFTYVADKQHPYRWTKDGEELALGFPEGADSVTTLDINNAGVIVGSAGGRAYKWTVS
ncbi:hypothetical protein [Lentzea cavernae]|uniref:Extracellular repeat, HAF family n=1 Tax=Lentzea cavernae TaxID=2020703 RepID=A0ABQ3LZG6_9PSEU|nr:hypothetical protein [Lentzea cavernae]GHH30067.1 hypothetical protein GCM10017774_07100 [Lentzea cavernae]